VSLLIGLHIIEALQYILH
jgi:hypothetical protein